jgi:hypothetical protein
MPAVEETSACIGFWPGILRVGNEILVYANRFSQSSEYRTNICIRTKPVDGAAKEDLDYLGRGEVPKKPEDPAPLAK